MNRQTKRQMAQAGHRQAARAPSARPAAEPADRTHRPAQYFAEVRGEMKKVAWPPRAEIINSSIVVLIGLVVMTTLIFGFDWVVGARRRLHLQVMVDDLRRRSRDDEPTMPSDGRDDVPPKREIDETADVEVADRREPRGRRASDRDELVDDARRRTSRSSRRPSSKRSSTSRRGASSRDAELARRRSWSTTEVEVGAREPSRARSTGPGAGTSCTPTPATRTR